MEIGTILNNEVNFLTGEPVGRDSLIRAIEQEFDFIQMWQGMIKPFGSQARDNLDRLIALSLRKLLCDDKSILKEVCPDFQMPPLTGYLFDCPGDDNNKMKLHEIWPDMIIKPQSEWLPIEEWLKTIVAWIDKDENDIPDAYTNHFYSSIRREIADRAFDICFIKLDIVENNQQKVIWKVKDEESKQRIFTMLKEKGYYDLTIRRLIKSMADQRGAHFDQRDKMWIRMANHGNNISYTALSVLATYMIYAATKQIKEMENYYVLMPVNQELCEQ